MDSHGRPDAREHEERDAVEVDERIRGPEHARERETDIEGDVRRRGEEREHEEAERLPRCVSDIARTRTLSRGRADGAWAKQSKQTLTNSAVIVPS